MDSYLFKFLVLFCFYLQIMLTHEEALRYLRDVLCIRQVPPHSDSGPDRLTFLNNIILRQHEEIPFQIIINDFKHFSRHETSVGHLAPPKCLKSHRLISPAYKWT